MRAIVAAEHLVKKIQNDYKEDISLVVMMGSHLYNDTHEKSDVDLYFVPKTKRGYELAMVFIMDGVGFDFWPISWERLERIASWKERIVSIVTEGKVLYHASDEDLMQFNQLRKNALSVENLSSLKDQAYIRFKEAYHVHFDLCHAETIADVRKYGIKLLYLLTEVIAMYNQTPIKRGRGKLKSEMMAMKDIPFGFIDHYDDVFISKDMKYIKKSFDEMMLRSEDFFRKQHHQKITSFKEQAQGFYEEIINNYNKIERACQRNDYVTALYAAAEIEFEYDWLFKDTDVKHELPRLLSGYHHEALQPFSLHVKNHQEAFLKLLKEQGVTIKTFKSIEALDEELSNIA